MSDDIIHLGSHMDTIDRLLQERAGIEGDLAEFGVYAGATTKQLAAYGRCVWAFDTFEGIPAESFTPGLDVDEPGKFCPPPRIFAELASTQNVFLVVGLIEETVQWFPRAKILLAYVDCDLYLSAKCAFMWLGEHVVPGGAIVLDDYVSHAGIRQAVAEFLEVHGGQFEFDGSEVLYHREKI